MIYWIPLKFDGPRLDEMPGLPLVPSLIIIAVVIGLVALVWRTNRNAKNAKEPQKHSNVKPLNTHDRAELISKGGLGDQGISGQ